MPQWLLLLCQAARFGNLEQLRNGVTGNANARCFGEQFSGGGTLLHEAAGHGHWLAVQLLVESGANVESRDRFMMTPLGWAAFGGHVKASETLLSLGAQLDDKDEFLMTPLATAAKEGHLQVAQLLISQKANVDAPAQLHLTPLMEAARRGHWDVARLLVKHHCDLDALDDLGRPALVQATLRGDLKMVKLLVESGANVFGNTNEGMPYYLTGTNEVNDYIYQQMKLGALMNRPWAYWVIVVAPLVGIIWALLHFGFGKTQSLQLLPNEEAPESDEHYLSRVAEIDFASDPFFQGALVLLTKSESQWRLALAFRMLEVSTVLVLIFGFGMAVVWWLVWLPLHLLLYLLPVLHRARVWWACPERILTEPHAAIKLPRTLALMCLMLAVLAWHHTQCYVAQCLKLAWTAPICRNQDLLPESLGSLPFDSLRNPSLDWYDILLHPYTSWNQPGTTVFGMLVQPYLITVAFVMFLCILAGLYCLWLLVKTLSAPCEEPAGRSNLQIMRQLLRTEKPERFPERLQPDSRSIYATVALLILDLIFDLNTVYTLMFTGNPVFAFSLMTVICRTLVRQMGNLYHFKEVLTESLNRGMMRIELMDMIDIHGFEAAVSLCLTSFSYWFCIQSAWQAMTQIFSILLSICSFSLFLFHRADVDRPSAK